MVSTHKYNQNSITSVEENVFLRFSIIKIAVTRQEPRLFLDHVKQLLISSLSSPSWPGRHQL